MDPQAPKPLDSQTQRRVKYGLNLAVTVVVAIALCVLINFISYRTLREGFARFDTSHMGRYSLSPQTRAVLRDLTDDYRIVTIFSENAGLDPKDAQTQAQQIEQATALVELYGQYSRHIAVDQLRPGFDLGRVDKFDEQVRGRYQDQLKSAAAALAGAQQLLADLHRDATAVTEKLKKVVDDQAMPDGKLRNDLIRAMQVSDAVARESGGMDKKVRAALSAALPAYAQVNDMLTGELEAFVESQALEKVTKGMREQTLPAVAEAPKELQPATTEAINAVIDQFEAAQKRIAPALAGLHGAPSLEEYTRLQSQLSQGNAVVVLGPRSVRVLHLSDFFPAPVRGPAGAAAPADGAISQSVFLGEERLTGDLVSLADPHPPLVVLVSTGNQPALGAQGMYNNVADRLRAKSIKIVAWSPFPHTPDNDTQQVPAPQPEPGQKAVWVLLPSENQSPHGNQNPNESLAIEHVKKRLVEGDGVLVVLAVSPASPVGAPSPVTPLLTSMGIAARTDQVVLQELTTPNSTRPIISTQFLIENWPQDMAITRSLSGLSGLFGPERLGAACPLTLSSGKDGQVRTWPLALVRGTNLFAYDLSMTQQEPKRDPATAKDAYVLAAAAQRDHARMVVIGDAMAASDVITGFPVNGVMGGQAELYGAAFPANAELFINSVYWLSGHEGLIAASARSQDLRRIQGNLSPAGRVSLAFVLMGATVLATALTGMGVWLVRRRA